MSIQDKLIDKVRKLLAKAESTTNQNEAEAFMAKANTLLIQHNLTMSEVQTEEESSMIEDEGLEFGTNSEEGKWEGTLMATICNFNLCQSLLHTKMYSKGGTMSIIGSPVNVESVLHMYTIARDTIRRLARKSYSDLRAEAKRINVGYSDLELSKMGVLPYRAVYIRSFLKGANQGLWSKMQAEAANRFEDDQDTKDKYGLMVVNNKEQLKQFMHDKYSNLKTSRQTGKASCGAALRAGRNAGKNVSFNKGVSSQSTLRLGA